MKNLTGLYSKNLVRVFGLLAFAAAMFSAVSAKTDVKTFEFGAGTANNHANVRTFYVPCGLDVKAAIKYSRKGDTGTANDVPIKVDLHTPDVSEGNEGEVADSKSVTATRNPQTLTVNSSSSARGCSLPWRIRISSANPGTPEFAVYGDITVTYDDSTRNVAVQDAGRLNLNSSNTETVNIGGANGLPQGVITLKGEWYHNLGIMPIKMRFELIDPDGNVVKTDVGYSNLEVNSCCSNDKLKLTYTATSCKRGQWKLRIKNISDGHDAIRVKPTASLNPDCPN